MKPFIRRKDIRIEEHTTFDALEAAIAEQGWDLR